MPLNDDIQRIHKICDRCKGTGTEDYNDVSDPQNPTPGSMPCQKCDGIGELQKDHLDPIFTDKIKGMEIQINDMADKINDVLDKVVDIKEKVDEL